MLHAIEIKRLRDRIPEFLQDIRDLSDFYEHNEEMLDIFEGNLLPYIEELMQETLDERYYKLIKHRILPINFSQKIIGKLSKSYAESPLRKSESQEFIDDMVNRLDIDNTMMLAEEYSYLNRGYALKPKLTNQGKIKIDVLPYDKFLVKADDYSDKTIPTVFIEFMGKTERQIVDERGQAKTTLLDYYIAYSDTEILGFDAAGNVIEEIAQDLDYLNPIGRIPFVYGNRSVSNIVPKQDTDFLKLSKILPLMLSDINGAIMFQCFTLIYGIDVEFNDATMSPNAIWDLRSNPKSEKNPQIGTLQPTVDSDKALDFIKHIIAFWLDSKGIDAGSIMSLDSKEMASGLSKALDEADTTEARKKSIKYLVKEEKDLFNLLARLNNYWVTLPQARDLGLKRVDEKLVEDTTSIEFKEPMPRLDITSEIANSKEMLQNGLSYREREIKRLHPYITDEEIDLVFFEYGESRYLVGDSEVSEGVDPANKVETETEIEIDLEDDNAPLENNEGL